MKKPYFSGKVFLKNMVVVKIEVSYKTKKVKNLCTNLKKAKQKLGEKVSVELFSLVNLLHSLDIGGRKSSYRLIIVPIDATIEKNGFSRIL